jgi:Peptidase family M13
MMVRIAVLWCLCALPVLAQEKTLHDVDPTLMDTGTDPCVNFYQYSCGNWLKQHPIPADESEYGRTDEVIDQNRLVLKAILEKAAAGGAERTPNEQKIGDYYATCINSEAIDQAGIRPVKEVLDRVAALKSKEEFPQLAAYLDSIGVNTFFSLGSEQDFKDATRQIASVDQADLGLPEKGYYDRQDADSVKLRNQYRDHVAKRCGHGIASGDDVSQPFAQPRRAPRPGNAVSPDAISAVGKQHTLLQLRTFSASHKCASNRVAQRSRACLHHWHEPAAGEYQSRRMENVSALGGDAPCALDCASRPA